jgi:hypothetical protein
MLKQYNNIHTLLEITYLQPPHPTVRQLPACCHAGFSATHGGIVRYIVDRMNAHLQAKSRLIPPLWLGKKAFPAAIGTFDEDEAVRTRFLSAQPEIDDGYQAHRIVC